VVLITQRLKRGPVDSRVGMFPTFQRSSAWRTVDLKARRAGVNQGLDGDRRLVSLVMIGACLSSKEESGIVCNQEGAE